MIQNNDTISRQEAIDAVETKIKKWNAVDGEGYHVGLGLRYTDVIDTLTELPSAQKTGKWMKDGERFGDFYCRCSVCEESIKMPSWAMESWYNFCPNCGSYNGGEQE